MTEPPRLPAVILAGGLATRMGGRDKPLLPFGGSSLIAAVAARLAPQCAALAVSANGDPARFADLGLPVLPDSVPDHPGPLAGVLAAMDWAAGQGASHVLTAAADTPFLPGDLAARLWAGRGPAGLAIAASPDETGRLRAHPTFGLWPSALRHRLRSDLGRGMRRLGLWADERGAVRVAFPATDPDSFFNVNTPGDLTRAEALLAMPPGG